MTKAFTSRGLGLPPGWWYEDTGNNKRVWVLNPDILEVQIAQEPISLTVASIDRAKDRLELHSTTLTGKSTAE